MKSDWCNLSELVRTSKFMAFENPLERSRRRQPEIVITDRADDANSLTFILSKTDTSVANALRRILIAEIPTMALDLVTIVENTSVLSDEFIAHRLGLIPLTSSNIEKFFYARECKCEGGCPNCTVDFTLDVTCNEDSLNVTTAHLKSSDSEVVPVDMNEEDKSVIVKLGKNQQLKFKGQARKGTGKEHAKWSPCCVATYQFDPDIQINHRVAESLSDEQKIKFVECCPTKVYSLNREFNRIDIENALDCVFCEECLQCSQSMGLSNLVSIDKKPERFIFTIETNGSLRPNECVMLALNVLKHKLSTLETDLLYSLS